jgi:hypothetical protein
MSVQSTLFHSQPIYRRPSLILFPRSTPMSSNRSLSPGFTDQNFVCICLHACFTFHPRNPWFKNPSNMIRQVKIVKLLFLSILLLPFSLRIHVFSSARCSRTPSIYAPCLKSKNKFYTHKSQVVNFKSVVNTASTGHIPKNRHHNLKEGCLLSISDYSWNFTHR